MIIYLYGPDSYRLHQKQQEILARFLQKNPSAKLQRFDFLEKEEEDQFPEFLSGGSLFSKKSLALLSGLEKASAQTLKAIKALAEDKDKTLVILSSKKLPAKFSWLLKKPTISQEFAELKGAELLSQLKKEAKERNYDLKSQEANELLEIYGSDLYAISAELEKRSLGSKEKELAKRKLDFFPAVNALRGALPVSKKLSILNQIFSDEEPAAVFNLLAALARPEAKKVFANYDLQIKSGKLEYKEALLDYTLN